MLNFTTKIKTLCLCAISLLFSSAVLADTYPTSDELIGRYHFSGKCSVEAPSIPAVNDYDVIILPAEGENNLYVCGLFGFGGGMLTTYNPEDGTLTCNTDGYLCSNVDMYSTYTGYWFMYSCTESPCIMEVKNDNGIILTATTGLTGMDLLAMQNITYEAGFALTKKSVNFPIEELAGSYDFKSTSGAIINFIEDAKSDFTIDITAIGEDKVNIQGLFGFDDAIEATYMKESGIILLPHNYTFSNEMIMGDDEKNGLVNYEQYPYFLVNDGALETPSSFVLNNGIDEVLEMPIQFSFTGGTAVNTNSDAVKSISSNDVNISVCNGTINVAVPEKENITVYSVQGTKVGSINGQNASFSNLTPGLYIVSAGKTNVKVNVR
jgi:hypothetical protein